MGTSRLLVMLVVGLMCTHAIASPDTPRHDDAQRKELEYAASQPDSRLATPEDAFNVYKAALRSGNLDDLKASVTPAFWQRWGDVLQQLSKEQLNEIGGGMENALSPR